MFCAWWGKGTESSRLKLSLRVLAQIIRLMQGGAVTGAGVRFLAVQNYKEGKTKTLSCMKRLKGRADPGRVTELLEEILV